MMSDNDDSTDFDEVQKKCNYCNKLRELAFNKPYCIRCENNMYKECRRCHKPYDDKKYFTMDTVRCNSCQPKFLKEREKRQKRAAAKEVTPGTSGKRAAPPSAETATKHDDDLDNGTPAKVRALLRVMEEQNISNVGLVILPSHSKLS